MPVEPFRIQVSDEILVDLQRRLAATRLPDEPQGAGWDYGTSGAYLRELIAHWRERFDWRAQEAALNRFAQVMAGAPGERVHAIHERARTGGALPLLLLHGWPDSIWRFTRLIPRLRDRFHVVAPSLPGFGFSDRPRRRGFTPDDAADRIAALMRELGHPRYGVHGGDWGATVAESLARRHRDAVVGLHLTEVPWKHLFTVDRSELGPEEQAYLERGQSFSTTEGAYALIQATKPQSLAMGLNDSPAGLAAWIVEKLRAWSDCDGVVERRFSKDDVLTNVMITWATQTVASSMRWYLEALRQSPGRLPRVEIPTAVAIFPRDLVPAPRAFAERIFDVRRYTAMPRGGHFAAFEEPELLGGDLTEFFGRMG